jgi:hypothetical protein
MGCISRYNTYMRVFASFILIFAMAPVAQAGNPRCFMHGIMTPKLENKEKTSLSDMIRLHFDANDKDKCEQMMESYCVHNVKEKEYSPARLTGSFKPDVDKSEETSYRFTESCKLETD